MANNHHYGGVKQGESRPEIKKKSNSAARHSDSVVWSSTTSGRSCFPPQIPQNSFSLSKTRALLCVYYKMCSSIQICVFTQDWEFFLVNVETNNSSVEEKQKIPSPQVNRMSILQHTSCVFFIFLISFERARRNSFIPWGRNPGTGHVIPIIRNSSRNQTQWSNFATVTFDVGIGYTHSGSVRCNFRNSTVNYRILQSMYLKVRWSWNVIYNSESWIDD